MSKLLKAKYGSPDRPLKIGEIEIPCYVLDNELRVVVQSGMLRALGMSQSGGSGQMHRLAQFIALSNIKQFIPNDLANRINNPIKFDFIHGGKTAVGYDATILVDICNALIDARNAGVLAARQIAFGNSAEIIIRGLAKTGIIALIDEATGFEKVREKDALQKFLDKFLLDEKAKWIPTFSDDFFEMIFKMKGWTWHYASTKKPQVVGHYINDFVYSRIAPQVLDELKSLNPSRSGKGRAAKHTQYMSADYGHPKLKEHIYSLIALGKASGFNWNTFKRLVERAFPKFHSDGSAAPELGFPED
jgi:hypothetical protein